MIPTRLPRVLAVAATLLLVGLAPATAARTAAAPSSASPVSLSGWCQHVGYDRATLIGSTAYDWRCVRGNEQAGVDVGAACRFEYGPQATAVLGSYKDPYSWGCVAGTPPPTPSVDCNTIPGRCYHEDSITLAQNAVRASLSSIEYWDGRSAGSYNVQPECRPLPIAFHCYHQQSGSYRRQDNGSWEDWASWAYSFTQLNRYSVIQRIVYGCLYVRLDVTPTGIKSDRAWTTGPWSWLEFSSHPC
jgi:hypothetical protein